jgi:hypothetical protein
MKENKLSLDDRIVQVIDKAINNKLNSLSRYPKDWPPVMNKKQVIEHTGLGERSVSRIFRRKDFPCLKVSSQVTIVGAEALWNYLNRFENNS